MVFGCCVVFFITRVAVMNLRLLIFFILLFFTKGVSPFFSSYKARSAYLNKDYKKAKEILETQQINNPKDAEINYNLGSAYYKLNDFENAKSNFARAVEYSSDNKELKEFSYFNWGNSFYQNSLRLLGNDWENKEFDENILDDVINQTKGSIEKFKNCLVLNKENQKAQHNKQMVESLLQKLRQKKQQQKQKKQEQEQKKQENEDQQDKKNGDQKDKKSDNQESQKQSQEKDSNKNSEKPDGQKQKKEGDQGSEDSKSDEDSGEGNNLDEEQDSREEQGVDQKDKHDTTSSEKENEECNQSDKKGKHHEEKMQQTGFVEQKDFEKELKEKGMRVILDDLQNDESKLQKQFIMQKSKSKQGRLGNNQKPW